MALFLEALAGILAIVMVFSIPLAWSPIGKAFADRLRGTDMLRNAELEARVAALEAEMHQLREALVMGGAGRHAMPGAEGSKSLGSREMQSGS
ncbi:MAG: hypothetical protein FJZ00_10050 [Candidatus Sericytochromatia bacterium]|uniref:Uncharacterized protein n=1 Tax=Candidatus Tanganyikabacteria bacterium TaxID=2961651 RepID=A0A937X3P9_9BACT|nr:hypothetical protein [Candidatus Tanganyikabacteria bacterium]